METEGDVASLGYFVQGYQRSWRQRGDVVVTDVKVDQPLQVWRQRGWDGLQFVPGQQNFLHAWGQGQGHTVKVVARQVQ